jgi:cystathionine beta-lyase
LSAHVDHQLHRRQATGDGAVLSFKTGDANFSQRVVSSTQLFTVAVSFGSVNSVISVPHAMSHASIPASLKQSLAPPPDLVRLSIGIEDTGDLVEDLTQAFNVSLPNKEDKPITQKL